MIRILFAFALLTAASAAFAQNTGTDAGTLASPASGSSLPRSRGNSFNPDISANVLMLYNNSGEGNLATSTEPNGLSLQEVELQFAADVDPYWRLYVLMSMHSEYALDPATNERTLEYGFEPEEAFAETISLPGVLVKAGKFKTALGKHNLLHTHAYPFIDAPLFQTDLLGEEGFNDVGLSASALLPLPWFFEVTVQAVRGESEGADYFNSRSSNDVVTIAHVKNLWDVNPSSTFEFGLSGASGENRVEDRTQISGIDLTYKWRPVEGGKYAALIVGAEGLQRTVKERGGAKNEGAGLATYAQYQLTRRTWVQGRAEWMHSKDEGAVTTASTLPSRTNKWSALVGFVPSEFSALRLQYDNVDAAGATENEHRVMAQLNFSIGAHPAHAY